MMDPAFVRGPLSDRSSGCRRTRLGALAPAAPACANLSLSHPHFALQFVGRKAILDWLNGTFGMHLEKIEETASGACAAGGVRARVAPR
jgi:hypothetical protein